VEGHGGSFQLPIFDADFLSKFPDLTAAELARLMKLAQMTADRSTSGCRMVEREEWPKLCEQRTASDIAALKEIVSVRPS
jgi:hypothetical protein